MTCCRPKSSYTIWCYVTLYRRCTNGKSQNERKSREEIRNCRVTSLPYTERMVQIRKTPADYRQVLEPLYFELIGTFMQVYGVVSDIIQMPPSLFGSRKIKLKKIASFSVFWTITWQIKERPNVSWYKFVYFQPPIDLSWVWTSKLSNGRLKPDVCIRRQFSRRFLNGLFLKGPCRWQVVTVTWSFRTTYQWPASSHSPRIAWWHHWPYMF